MLYLAIDQHRKQLTVNLRNEQGDVLLKRQVSTEWNRMHAFGRNPGAKWARGHTHQVKKNKVNAREAGKRGEH